MKLPFIGLIQFIYRNDCSMERLVYSNPNTTLKPPSTPLKPMKAKESKPAVTRTIAMPCMPLGMRTKESCSRKR